MIHHKDQKSDKFFLVLSPCIFQAWIFLAPGTKLPPQRELADFLDINFTTITRAYKVCELKGLIHAVTGSGTFVSPNAARSITISKDKISSECIDLGFVASFEQTNPIVAVAAKRVMEKSYLEQLFDYNDPTGKPHHKIAGLNWMRAFGIHAGHRKYGHCFWSTECFGNYVVSSV
jgi:DNA-binding transcriptional MocR family regulator